jgi:riboflavin biosynthesis pyrimidine reductase
MEALVNTDPPKGTDLIRLFPQPAESRPLEGLYLDTPLVTPERKDRCFVYSNYVTSLDGRISMVRPADGREVVPASIANPRDWRLFQELAGHADVLITSGRYLRDLRAGHAQDVLPVGSAEAFADIREARRERGLRPQPDVAVLSGSADFPVPPALLEQGRQVHVFAPASAPTGNLEARRAQGASLETVSNTTRVGGRHIVSRLSALGYRRVYCVTGPYVLHSLVSDGVLDALFLTTVHRLIGGERFATVVEGPALDPAADFHLTSMYYDPSAPEGAGQIMARYDREPS